ncbi:vacuolar import and degradation protein-domain-containing protein [Kalaharituber pfeilii]|nr:vacuolar import and degradation protein-domain-containing protein [Kalaharituber pfeilii]
MPPSNSPADTPVQTHTLPRLIYLYPAIEGDTTDPDSPTSHPQPPTGADIFSHTTTQLAPLLPLPTPSGSLQLLPPIPGIEHRFRRSGTRRITLRDPDPRLSSRDQAYGPRIPALLPGQRQSLYDWAPATSGPLYFSGAAVETQTTTSRENEDVAPPRPLFGRMRYSSPPLSATRLRPRETRNSDYRTSPVGAPTVATQDSSANRPLSIGSSLRRYIRGQSHRPRNIWAGYVAEAERDRERTRQRDRDRELRDIDIDDAPASAFDSSWIPVRPRQQQHPRPRYSPSRDFSSTFSSLPYSARKDLEGIEGTLSYLAKLRYCISVGESLRLALKSGFTRDNAWRYDGCEYALDDFLLDTRMLKAPETSWLAVGGTFWGTQTTLCERGEFSGIGGGGGGGGGGSGGSGGGGGGGIGYTTTSPAKWKVKVTISGVDYERLKLNGTMEAYAEWEKHIASAGAAAALLGSSGSAQGDKACPEQQSSGSSGGSSSSSSSNSSKETQGLTPITTYLEGEIIDFRTHTLQTTSYPSTLTHDALYWRKLEPFSFYEGESLVHALTSKKFLARLMDEYVLMRWKEKCFIHRGSSGNTRGAESAGSIVGVGLGDQEGAEIAGGGQLTIGGFYFVSMRRSDGCLRGYYYDPKSTPYQELVMRPRKRVFPRYEFR